MKQTAVEWLREQYHKVSQSQFGNLFEQAKEMEKQQIIDAYANGEDNVDNDGCTISKDGAEQYYNETFKK